METFSISIFQYQTNIYFALIFIVPEKKASTVVH